MMLNRRYAYVLWCFLLVLTNVLAQQKDLSQEHIPVEIEFSDAGGFYEEPVILELRSPGAAIYSGDTTCRPMYELKTSASAAPSPTSSSS